MFIKKQKMRMSLRYIKFFIGISALIISISAKSQVVDEIIAKVDNNIIMKSDLEKAYLDALANGARPTPELKCYMLAGMVREKLMVARSEVDSVSVLDAEVDMDLNRRIEMILAQYNGSEESIIQYYGKTIEDIRLELRDVVKEQMIVGRMQDFITKDLTVTPSEVKRFFRKINPDSLPYYDMQVQVAQLIKNVEPGKEEKEKVREQLIELRRRIVNGEDFAELAVKFSEGPTGPGGGDLGWSKRSAMVPEYEAGALALKPGEISMPVESKFGFHLIKLHARRGNEYHSSHILIRPKASEEDINKTKNFVDSLRTLIINDSIEFEKAAREFSDDEMTSGSGGYFLDQSGGTQISIRELDAEIYFAIDSMEVGTISHPTIFKSHEGKEAVRVFYYKTSKPPHVANLKDDWQKIQAAALMEKKNNKLIQWFESIKGDVFIDIDEAYHNCNIVN